MNKPVLRGIEEPHVWWVCHGIAPDGRECGNTVLSVNRPASLPWDDGHRCSYVMAEPEPVPSETQLKRFRLAALQTWDVIGEDFFTACEEQGDSNATLAREDVLELILDASRMESNGKLNQEDLTLWRKMTSEQQREAIRPAFPHAFYGR